MNKKFFDPVLCAVIGAVIAYYGFSSFFKPAFVLISVTVAGGLIAACLSLADTLSLLSGYNCCAVKTIKIKLFLWYFTVGFSLGAAVLCASFRGNAVKPGLDYDKITGITGILLDDPRVNSSKRGVAIVRLTHSYGENGVRVSAKGKTPVFFSEEAVLHLKEFGRGCVIFTEGRFVSHSSPYGALFRASSTHIIKPSDSLNRQRTKARLLLVTIFSDKRWGGLALALLIGIKDNLDMELAARYRNAGCSYILALSGMHLAIISSIITFMLRKPFGIKAAALIGAMFIIIYIYIVGAQPSLARAGIAYIIGSIAILHSLNISAVQVISLSFLTQILIDPSSGKTISFILSYLALAGILFIGKPLSGLLRGRIPPMLAEPLSVSLGAFIATMAVSASFFGNLRPAGILAGLIMVPLTTVFMIISIIFIIVHFTFPLLCRPLDTALSILYAVLEKITNTAGKFPALTVSNTAVSVIILSILPFAIIYFCNMRLKVRSYVERFD
ncbi:MAG: ComEC/Rec2 family competence protein [Spirochaetaceae bacterium]|jgi:competence protein ComEC|nr:ComEC/Rec2 family competence protein [Spirochaetaceae bacterium]